MYIFLSAVQPNSLISKTAAIAVLMAIWWMTETIPIAATALLTMILFPVFGVISASKIAGSYINSTIFLFIGGFLIALTMQRWNLHRRIALKIILMMGGSPQRIILGFMVASAFLSMWISNTATTEMILPILASISVALEMNPLLLMITATLSASMAFMLPVATPPNAVVFGSGRIRVPQMVRTGIILNFIGVAIVIIAVYFIGTTVFEIDINTLPIWTK